MPPTPHDPRAAQNLALNLQGRLVEILVGEKEEHITLYEQALCSNCIFFEAALSHDWKEAKEGKVKLPEEAMSSFTVYANWIYTHQIHLESVELRYASYACKQLFRFHTLGAGTMDGDFQDAIIDEIIARSEQEDSPTSSDGRLYPGDETTLQDVC